MSKKNYIWTQWRRLPQPEGYYQAYMYRHHKVGRDGMVRNPFTVEFARKDGQKLTLQEKLDLDAFVKYAFSKIGVKVKANYNKWEEKRVEGTKL